MNATEIKRGFGFDNDGRCDWEWAGSVRLFLSRWLGIGNWFGPFEECERCGVTAWDNEFLFERVGFRRHARCVLREPCNDAVRDMARSAVDQGGGPDGDR